MIFSGNILAFSIHRFTTFSDGRSRTSFRFLLASAIALARLHGISIFEFFYGIDAGGLQQFGIFLAHAFDAHAVGDVGPVQAAASRRNRFSRRVTFRPLTVRAASSRRSVDLIPADLRTAATLAVDPVDIGDGIGHPLPPPVSYLWSLIKRFKQTD